MKGYLQCFVPRKTLPQAGSNKPQGDTMTLLWGPQATPCCLHNQLSTASAHLELSFGLRWFLLLMDSPGPGLGTRAVLGCVTFKQR